MFDAEKNAPDSETDRAFGNEPEMESPDIREEVHRLSKELGISIEEAERSVYNDLGMEAVPMTRTVPHLSELEDEMKAVTIRARVITVHKQARKDGEGEYSYGLLGDSKTTIKFSAWSIFDYGPGDALLIQNVSVRRFRGDLEVVINDRSHISSIEDLEGLLPVAEDGVPGTIGELERKTKRIDLEVRVIDISTGEIKVKDRTREVMRGTFADRSGRINFTGWDILPLELGKCYRVIGGYIKEYRGILRLNLDAGAVIRVLSDDRLPSMEELREPQDVRLVDLMEGRLSGPIKLRGTVLDVRSGSGLFRRCQECGRRLVKGQCTVHGRTEGEEDLAVRAIFDDGTGTCMLRGNRTFVESLLGRSIEEISEEVRSTMDPDMVSEELSSILVGHIWTVQGDPLMDDFGVSVSILGMAPGFDQEQLKEEISLLLEVVS